MPITLALSGAKMARDLGVTRDFLSSNVAATSKIQQVASDRFLGRNMSAGTGNSQQVQPWYDVPVADWTTGNYISQWSTYQNYLSGVIESNKLASASPVSHEVFSGNLSTVNGHIGAVLAPNGKIYCMTQYSVSV